VGLAIRWRTYDRLVGAFANAVLADGRRPSLTLCWLAGLLEAEGSFLKPTPTDPNLPIVGCPMTDRDVVECVAELFGVSPAPIDKGDRKTQYVARLKGSVAVALMRDLRPLMGARRQLAIDRALRLYHAPERKLSYPAAEDIRRRHDAGETAAALARRYSVTHPTIRAVLRGRIYKAPPDCPWRRWMIRAPGVVVPGATERELAWLAGWLEGEGSFIAPPPSSPRRPRISARSTDRDVVNEAARLLGVTPQYSYSGRDRSKGWSPTWRLLKQGTTAITFMRALAPMLGERKARHVQRAIVMARAAQLSRGRRTSVETRGLAPLSSVA
jgi:hypothetical protein